MNGAPGGRALLIVIGAVVVAAMVAGLLVLGSPVDERARRIDERRLRELQELRSAVDLHFRRDAALPDSLEELARRSPLPVRMTEPDGGRLYGYEVIDSTSYRLCATFTFPTPDHEDSRYYHEKEWAHGAGRQCFRFRVRLRDRDEIARPEDATGPILEGISDSTP